MKFKFFLPFFFTLVVFSFVFLWFNTGFTETGVWWRERLLGGIAYVESITPFDLRLRHAGNRLKILIVPGHDNESWGTKYRLMREADLNLEASRYLYNFFKNDNHFEVLLARNLSTGEYIPELSRYFTDHQKEITDFITAKSSTFSNFINSGALVPLTGVDHGFAKSDVAYRLYGINKWANENDVDVVIHIHHNDYAGRRDNKPGKYSGFAIYVPESQYPNSRASIELGESISRELQRYFPLSNLPQENKTVVEDQELIAIGAKGTRKGASILVEYGYIYEPQFNTLGARSLILQEFAYQTYKGIQNYFGDDAGRGDTAIFSDVRGDLSRGLRDSGDVLVLQKILVDAGYYPPRGKTFNDCPVNGNFGQCVEDAVINFQRAQGINPVGKVGPETRNKLNALFGGRGTN